MPWTQSDIDLLKSAIASGRGVKQLTFQDQTVVFWHPVEMLELLAVMEQDVNRSTRQNFRVAATSKGV